MMNNRSIVFKNLAVRVGKIILLIVMNILVKLC